MRLARGLLLGLFLWNPAVVTWGAETAAASPDARVDFDRDIRPILADRCFTCHGPDEKALEADLRLDKKEGLFGDLGGYHAVVPGKLEASELFTRISSDDPTERMPPRKSKLELTSEQVGLIGRWIEQGAAWSAHWAFEPPVRRAPPKVNNPTWPRNSIDNFVLARLEREGLDPSSEAPKTTLIRRVTLNLTGLPPTSEEVAAFLADQSSDAYERLIDRLLASPRYGEHMAVTWLDAARYADTDGYQNDRLRYMHVWRDWVIMALNENKPFDQFVIEQVAGDMLPDATLRQQIATGFGRNHRINSEGGAIADEWIVEYVVDRVETVSTVFLGLTLGCARCHEHKYDPITQKEFYQLYAFFNNVPEWGLGPNNGNSPPFIDVPKSWPKLSVEEDRAITPKPYKIKVSQTSVKRPQPGGDQTVMVMHEMTTARPTYLLQRGQYDRPDKREQLAPAVPAVFGVWPESLPRNRLGLAQWLMHPEHPLTARVTVNRYWQQFFGSGLVRTSENFGTQGEHPSHPELLDWLASEFVEREWDVKAIQKLILTSASYRQDSSVSPMLARRDPQNRLLARGPRVRLTAQIIRDQALAASGLLVEQLGGPSVKPYMPPGIWKSISNRAYQQDHGDSLYRRSLYTYWRRTTPPPTMMNFNASDREVCTVRKDLTNTPLQALTLMNNIAFVEAARFLAQRMITDGSETIEAQIGHGFGLVTGRAPKPGELALLLAAHGRFVARYQSSPAAAKRLLSIGEQPRDSKVDTVQHAAMTMVASTILNLDEAVTKE